MELATYFQQTLAQLSIPIYRLKTTKKTNSIIAIIYRSLLSPKLHQQLIVRLKQPIFEYTRTGWSPVLRKHVKKIENVQNVHK